MSSIRCEHFDDLNLLEFFLWWNGEIRPSLWIYWSHAQTSFIRLSVAFLFPGYLSLRKIFFASFRIFRDRISYQASFECSGDDLCIRTWQEGSPEFSFLRGDWLLLPTPCAYYIKLTCSVTEWEKELVQTQIRNIEYCLVGLSKFPFLRVYLSF